MNGSSIEEDAVQMLIQQRKLGRKLGVLVWVLAAVALIGCEQQRQISDADIQVMREEQMAEELESPETVVVDVRKPEAYAEGHLPGAINIYLPDIRRNDGRLAEAERIIVYGSGWRDPLSTAAAKKMMALGYTNVGEFKGGIEVWENADRRLVESVNQARGRAETGEADGTAGEREADGDDAGDERGDAGEDGDEDDGDAEGEGDEAENGSSEADGAQ